MTDNMSSELEAVCSQLDAVREAVAQEVDRTWPSAWKSPDTVDAKVRARKRELEAGAAR